MVYPNFCLPPSSSRCVEQSRGRGRGGAGGPYLPPSVAAGLPAACRPSRAPQGPLVAQKLQRKAPQNRGSLASQSGSISTASAQADLELMGHQGSPQIHRFCVQFMILETTTCHTQNIFLSPEALLILLSHYSSQWQPLF